MEFINLKPFKIDSYNDLIIESKGKYYDMHTFADFTEIKYDVNKKHAVLKFLYPGKWLINEGFQEYDSDFLLKYNVINKDQRSIFIILSDVNILEIKPRDKEIPFTEDNCLSEIYLYSDYENEITFNFHSGMEIKAEAAIVEFVDTLV